MPLWEKAPDTQEFQERQETSTIKGGALGMDATVIEGDIATFRQIRMRRANLVILPLAFLLLFLGLVAQVWGLWVTAIALLFFWFYVNYMTRQYLQESKPYLHISSLGIRINVAEFETDTIFWEEITSAEAKPMAVLGIQVRNPQKTMPRVLCMKNVPMKGVNTKMLQSGMIYFDTSYFPLTPEEIIKKMAPYSTPRPKQTIPVRVTEAEPVQ